MASHLRGKFSNMFKGSTSRPATPQSAGPIQSRVYGIERLKKATEDFLNLEVLTDAESQSLQSSITLPEPKAVTDLIQDLNGKRGNKASKVEPFLNALQNFSSVIDTFIQSNPKIAALVWGSVKFVLLAVQNYFSFFKYLTGVLQQFDRLFPVFDEFSKSLRDYLNLRDAIAEFYAIVIMLCCEALVFLRKQGPVRIIVSMHKPWELYFGEFENSLRWQENIIRWELLLARDKETQKYRLAANFERENAAAHRSRQLLEWEANRKQGMQLENLKASQQREGMAQEEWRIQTKYENKIQRRIQLLDRISTFDYLEGLLRGRESRQAETGAWLFDTGTTNCEAAQFQQWFHDDSSSLLWCHGSPGSGKSFLATAVADNILQSVLKQNTITPISYHFCIHKYHNSLEVATIIRSLTRQMLNVFTLLPERVEKDLNAFFEKGDRTGGVGEAEWFRLFQMVAARFPTAYIILDGIDECNDRDIRVLLGYIDTLLKDNGSLFKILLFSRMDTQITERYKDRCQFSLSEIAHRNELTRYIEERLNESVGTNLLTFQDPAIHHEIAATLQAKSQGMFLWLKLQIDELCRQKNDHEIRLALKHLPRGLDETYARILERIDSKRDSKLAIRIFQWMATAWRPLTCSELIEAVSFDPGDTSWSQAIKEKSPATEPKMLESCENLVNVRRNTNSVEFIHFTVLEFLRGTFLLNSTPTYNLCPGHETWRIRQNIAQFRLDMEHANIFIAEICLTYLNLDVFDRQVAVKKKPGSQFKFHASEWIPPMINQDPSHTIVPKSAIAISKRILKSSAGNSRAAAMPSHLRTDNKSKTSDQILAEGFPLFEYLTGGPTFSGWLHHCRALSPHTTPGPWAQLHSFFFARFQSSTIRLPWRDPTAENLVQESSNTPYMPELMWGVQNDNHAVVSLVVEAIKQEGQDPRCYFRSTYCGSGEICQTAFERGCLGVIQSLLDVHVDHNVLGTSSALNSVIHTQKSLAILEMLLDNGLDVRQPIQNHNGRTILQSACEQGNLDAVKRLLQAGANVNAPPASNCGKTALQEAAAAGHFEIARRLLQAGADVNARPSANGGKTALQAACRGGHVSLVELLLAHGASPNAAKAEEGGETALEAASLIGSTEILEGLFSCGAILSLSKEDFLTYLKSACLGGHNWVLQRLIDMYADALGSDCFQTSLMWGRALEAACEGGNLAIIEYLIAIRAEDVTFEELKLGIKSASRTGNVVVMESLLRLISNNNSILAAMEFDILISLEARVLKLEAIGRACLEASRRGHVAIIELLLPLIFKFETFGEITLEMLIEASSEGRVAVIQFLHRLSLKSEFGGSSKSKWSLESQNKGQLMDIITCLSKVCKGGHLECLQELLKFDSIKNQWDQNWDREGGRGRDFGFQASKHGHLNIITWILQEFNGRFPSQVNIEDWILVALIGKHVGVAEMLLDFHDNFNLTPSPFALPSPLLASSRVEDQGGEIYLVLFEYACWAGSCPLMKRLFRKCKTQDRQFPKCNGLHYAANEGEFAAMEWLLEQGIEVDGRFIKREWAEDWMDRLGTKIISVESENTALDLAVLSGHLAVAQRLLLAGARFPLYEGEMPNTTRGMTMLRAACSKGRVDLVRWLLMNETFSSHLRRESQKYDYQPNMIGLLELACTRNAPELVEVLLDAQNGIHLSWEIIMSNILYWEMQAAVATLLLAAAQCDCTEVLELILWAGFKTTLHPPQEGPDMILSQHTTANVALACAAVRGDLAAVRLLMAAGIDLDARLEDSTWHSPYRQKAGFKSALDSRRPVPMGKSYAPEYVGLTLDASASLPSAESDVGNLGLLADGGVASRLCLHFENRYGARPDYDGPGPLERTIEVKEALLWYGQMGPAPFRTLSLALAAAAWRGHLAVVECLLSRMELLWPRLDVEGAEVQGKGTAEVSLSGVRGRTYADAIERAMLGAVHGGHVAVVDLLRRTALAAVGLDVRASSSDTWVTMGFEHTCDTFMKIAEKWEGRPDESYLFAGGTTTELGLGFKGADPKSFRQIMLRDRSHNNFKFLLEHLCVVGDVRMLRLTLLPLITAIRKITTRKAHSYNETQYLEYLLYKEFAAACLYPGRRTSDVVDFLIEAGVDLKNGPRFLTMAASSGNWNMVDRLLRLGSNPNEATFSRKHRYRVYTPIHRACKHGNITIVRRLLVAGASALGIANFAPQTSLPPLNPNEELGISARPHSNNPASLIMEKEGKEGKEGTKILELLLSKGGTNSTEDYIYPAELFRNYPHAQRLDESLN
ncbi:hypothetical protein DFH27DRAFT_657060 [Peziza echinospora]|nr:hypothetical protein DFH27DRAFT_657060 [Peziza echinospora]